MKASSITPTKMQLCMIVVACHMATLLAVAAVRPATMAQSRVKPAEEQMMLNPKCYEHDGQKETAVLVLSFQRSGSSSFVRLLRDVLHYEMHRELLNHPGGISGGDPDMNILKNSPSLRRNQTLSCGLWDRVRSLGSTLPKLPKGSHARRTPAAGGDRARVFGFKVFPAHVSAPGQLERSVCHCTSCPFRAGDGSTYQS